MLKNTDELLQLINLLKLSVRISTHKLHTLKLRIRYKGKKYINKKKLS